jgi:hypothetical protein
MSPTQRSLEYLRRHGYLADICERWIPRTKIRKDLFGFIDIMAVGAGEVLAIQSTDGSNHSHRVNKIRSLPAFPILKHYFTIEVWSWAKRGRERKTWQLRRERVEEVT